MRFILIILMTATMLSCKAGTVDCSGFTFKQKAPYKRFYYNKNNERRTLWKDLKI